MKNSFLFLLMLVTSGFPLFGQQNSPNDRQRKAIASLIDQYSKAREKNDTLLLKDILTSDVDQLVSNGEWRTGVGAAVQGMLKSSTSNPGTRTLQVANIKMFNPTTAIVDCRYEIRDTNDSVRKMWSSFIVVTDNKKWRISAIRNMVPANQ